MNTLMQQKTRRLLARFMIILVAACLLLSLLVLSLRYKDMLTQTISSQAKIIHNMTAASTAAGETDRIIAEFNRLFPAGYGVKSPEHLLYARLDALQEALKTTDMTIKNTEYKEGMMSMEFSATIPFNQNSVYTTIINQLGHQETLAFPFVTINAITIGTNTAARSGGLQMLIEGVVSTPAPQQPGAGQ